MTLIYPCRYQEYLTVRDPWRLVRIPKDVDLALAATVPCSGITAINAIEICGRHIERAIDIKGKKMVKGHGIRGERICSVPASYTCIYS